MLLHLQSVASISAGNDRVIGDMIAEALDKVGTFRCHPNVLEAYALQTGAWQVADTAVIRLAAGGNVLMSSHEVRVIFGLRAGGLGWRAVH